jgi:hypothetical protein
VAAIKSNTCISTRIRKNTDELTLQQRDLLRAAGQDFLTFVEHENSLAREHSVALLQGALVVLLLGH